MKHDKHKAKKNARYKKQHNINIDASDPRGKKLKDDKSAKQKLLVKESRQKETLGENHDELLIEKQPEYVNKLQDPKQAHPQSYSRRKIESNWSRYEDFQVENTDQVEKPTVARGADFQTLISKSGGAASQLRMKDETWDEDCRSDESETEISELFKVNFREIADRLQAVPLHERLRIPVKYFEKDVLNRINDDAARHAKRVQRVLDEEEAKRVSKREQSEMTRKANIKERDISLGSDSCTSENRLEPAGERDYRGTDISNKCNNMQYDSKRAPSPPSSVVAVTSTTEDDRNAEATPRNHEDKPREETSHIKPESAVTSSTTDVPVKSPSGGAEEDLEDWLDEYLSD